MLLPGRPAQKIEYFMAHFRGMADIKYFVLDLSSIYAWTFPCKPKCAKYNYLPINTLCNDGCQNPDTRNCIND